MKNVKVLLVLFLFITCVTAISGATQQVSAMEGRLVYFDGEPAANVQLVFEADTDIKEEMKDAVKKVTTDRDGLFRVSNLLWDGDYTLTQIIPPSNSLNISNLRSSEKFTKWVNFTGTKMLKDIIVLPHSSYRGWFYQKDSSSKLVRLNDMFQDSCSVNITFSGGYSYVDSLEIADKPVVAVLEYGGLLFEQGYEDAEWNTPEALEIQYLVRALDWVPYTNQPNGNSSFNISYKVQENGLDLLYYGSGNWSQWRYYSIKSSPGKYLFQHFTKPGSLREFSNYGYVVDIK